MSNLKDYGSEYPYTTWRREVRRSIIATAAATAVILIFSTVLVVTICILPEAIEKELERQVAVVEKSLGGQK